MDLRTQLAGGGGDLTLTVSPDRTQFDVSVGVNAELGDGFALELIGNSSFSDSRDVLSGQVRLQWQF